LIEDPPRITNSEKASKHIIKRKINEKVKNAQRLEMI